MKRHLVTDSMPVAAVVGLALGLAAVIAAPTSALLPAPGGTASRAFAALALAAAFTLGLRRPLVGFYAALGMTVLEGAVRRWVFNDIAVFLVKDFLLVGIYVAVIPRLGRQGLRRQWWLLAPLALYLALALVWCVRSHSVSEMAIGLRAYMIDVPLLWVAPALLATRRRVQLLLGGVLATATLESILGVVQSVSGQGGVNKLVSGSALAAVTIGGRQYIRPIGTFMQSADMSTFLALAALAGFAFLTLGNRRAAVLAAAGTATIGVAVVYTASRTLFGTVVLGLLFFAALGAMYRVFTRVAGTLATVAVGVALALFAVGPSVNAVHKLLTHHSLSSPAASALGSGSTSVTSGLLTRSAGLTGGEGGGIWNARIRPPFDFILNQGLLGHGTGTSSLGAEYVTAKPTFSAESEYAKFAWELGLPGLFAFLWFLIAVAVAALVGLRRAVGWERQLAAVGFAAALVVPLWMVVSYAMDVPIAGELYFALAGVAAALGVGKIGTPGARGETIRGAEGSTAP